MTAGIGASGAAHGRTNPIRNLVEQIRRPEVMILVDTSGSMRGDDVGTAVGAECTAHDPEVDLCNDGFCSGGEDGGSCPNDCNIASNATATAGSAPKCQSSTSKIARMMSAKRALRHVLPDLRTVASIGLASFRQEGYFRYYQGTAGATKKVTVYLSEWELKRFGGWNTGTDSPQASFAWNGTTMTLLSGAGLAETRDSLYRRASGTAYVEKRFTWATGNRKYNDGTYEWQYTGSYYTYDQMPILTGTTYSPTTYYGPQFVSAGTTWVYHRFNNDVSTGVNQFIDGTNYADGRVLVPFTTTATQSDHDLKAGEVLSRLNWAVNGGLHGSGGTPTRQAIAAMRAHFVARADGTAPYSAPDTEAGCRTRYLIIITDGVADSDPLAEVVNLYNQYPSNPIKTIAIGIPGSSMAQLDAMADRGDDGVANSSATGYYAGTEAALVNILKTVLFAALKGDYVVSSAGVSTSDNSTIAGNIVVLPSTEYPGYFGRLRALDLTTSCVTSADCPTGYTCHIAGTCASQVPATCRCQKWEASQVLATQIATSAPRKRNLYTGRADKNSGNPIPLTSASGPCALASDPGCTSGVTDAWLIDNPGASEIRATITWLVNKNLGPLISSVPASIGPPPYYGLSDHSSLETSRGSRDQLVYITSNDGILHAFRAADGSEAFGYVPPDAWPLLYKLYKAGGQDPDPTKFLWVLAQSPRIEDIRAGAGDWRTQLHLGMGPAGEEFSVIDVTNPGDCSGVPPCVPAYNTPPFTFVANGHSQLLSVGSYLGETRSIPTLYWDNSFKPMASFASGYRTATNLSNNENEFYFRIDDLADGASKQWKGSPSQTYAVAPDAAFKLNNGGAQVTPFVESYAVMADVATAVKDDGNREILASYVATMNGTIIRMDEGKTGAGDRVVVLGPPTDALAGVNHPFHFGPAVAHRPTTAKKVAVAAASGSYWELDPWMKDASFTSKIFLLQEDNAGTVISDKIAIAVNGVCTAVAGYTVASGACPDGAPSARALPVDRPLMIEDTARGLLETFFLYYDPPATACATGSSWVIRVRLSSTGVELFKATKYADTLSGGMTVVGGGKDIAISRSGKAGQPASVEKLKPEAFDGGTLLGTPRVEVWREVR
jgi:hypothetical protein